MSCLSLRILTRFLLLLLCFLGVSLSADPSCSVDPSDLRNLRYEVLDIWIERTNYGQEHLQDVYDLYATKDTLPDGSPSPYKHRFTIDGFGSFVGLEECAEYAKLAADENNFQLMSERIVGSERWIDSDTVEYWQVTNYTFNYLPGKPTLDGFFNDQVLRFRPCTAEVWTDYSRQDPLVARYIEFTIQNIPPETTCSKIMDFCTGPNQVYPSYEDCLSYMTAVSQNPRRCPSDYIANSTTCHDFHANAAFYLPEIHCQHVRPYDSPTCKDFCMQQGCGSCHPDARCAYIQPVGQLFPSYGCVCKEGYSGDGISSCSPQTCTAKYQCPSPFSFSNCSEGLCGCKETFTWNSSGLAVSSKNVCGCSEGEYLSWVEGPECIPLGRCREVWQCPQSKNQYSSVSCRSYGNNPLIPYGSCICNYGYDSIGFAYPCTCSAPKREVWSSSLKANVCLDLSECTEDYQCSSGICSKAPGSWMGYCA